MGEVWRLHRRLFWKAKESMFIDGSEGKNENQNSDIINHGSGASGSWNENQNSDIISHGSGASGSW